jgi:hypothetical protein
VVLQLPLPSAPLPNTGLCQSGLQHCEKEWVHKVDEGFAL